MIELAIDPEVVPTWGLWEAFREILQGAIDAKVPYSMTYNEQSHTVTIKNTGMLSKASLLIGHSTKRDDSTTIGQHGEGYKLAAAVLLRLGKPFFIYNDKEVWTFKKQHSRKFKTEVICVNVQKWRVAKTGEISWEVKDISPEEYQSFSDNVQIEGDLKGPNGYILLDQPGQVYSGGLFIQHHKDLHYGYNFNPGALTLHRDRNLVSDFDILWETSTCWAEQLEALTLIRDGVPDVSYISKRNDLADDACKLFYLEHGKNAVPCYDEDDKVLGANNVIVSNTYRQHIIASPLYHIPNSLGLSATPFEQLKTWYDWAKLEYNFSDRHFETLLERSKTWVLFKF